VPKSVPNNNLSGVPLFKVKLELARMVLSMNRLAQDCALEPKVQASIPRPMDVVRLPLEELGRKSEKFARAMARSRPDFESHFRDNQNQAIVMAWQMANIAAGCERTRYEYACACLRAHRQGTGYAILKALAEAEDSKSKFVTAARKRIARLAWKSGDTEVALRAMRSQRGRAARAQYRSWLGISTVRDGLLMAEAGDIDSARLVLAGGLRANGMDDEVADAVAAVYLKASSLNGEFDVPALVAEGQAAEADPPGAPLPIILSGFGWSGSGAVADFLTGHSDVVDVFAGREMGLWTGKYGLDRLYAHFHARGYNRRLLLEFLTRHCFGHRFLGDSKGTKSLGGMWAWLDDAQKRRHLAQLWAWLDAIARWHEDPECALLDAFQAFSMGFLSLLEGREGSKVFLSNCIPSDSIAGIRMFREPVVIVSWRDPGDAYASKSAAFPDTSLTFEGWRSQLTRRIDRYLSGKREVADCASVWLDVSFEEFVRDARSRERLLERLQLDSAAMQSTFDPAVSARNIGIHEPGAGAARTGWIELARAVAESRQVAQSIGADRD